ncbi:hypothetical protein, partial [Hymenobacter coccineus]|uniref:hypothetical protein n=1 Tax=Hymenobacter coccineus TaxID=1908235 RepID=UPI00130143D6
PNPKPSWPGPRVTTTAPAAAAAPWPTHTAWLGRFACPVLALRGAQSEAFLAWAAGYDDGSCGGSRTLANPHGLARP